MEIDVNTRRKRGRRKRWMEERRVIGMDEDRRKRGRRKR